MGIKCDVVRALYNPIVKAAHYRCNTRAMTKTTVHLVVSTQDCTKRSILHRGSSKGSLE